MQTSTISSNQNESKVTVTKGQIFQETTIIPRNNPNIKTLTLRRTSGVPAPAADGVDRRVGGRLHGGGGGGGGVGGVRALVHRALEEVVLQRVVRRDPRLRVEVQHAQDQVLEQEEELV